MTWILNEKELDLIKKDIPNERLKKVKSILIFVGHAHSGHSLIGALLDAHPKITIANEANIAKLIKDHKYLTANDLMSILISGASNNIKSSAWHNTGYSYKVSKSQQGKTHSPVVLGDKKGGGNVRVIRQNPHLLEDLSILFTDRLKFVQVVRNPYDNIAALSHYWGEPLHYRHVERYFENAETCDWIEKSGFGSFYRLMFSDFIKNPVSEYIKLLNYLDITFDINEIERYLSIVKKTENKRSLNQQWPEGLKKEIQAKAETFSFLEKYSVLTK